MTSTASTTSFSPASRSWPDRGLLLEAVFCLGLARLSILIPFRWLTRGLRQQLGESPIADDPVTRGRRQRVAWAVRAVSPRTPWSNNCLAQAVAGKYMLRRRRLASTLYLGVAKDDQANFAAHAWLRSGDLVLTGGDCREDFAVIAAFCDRPGVGYA